MTGDPEEHQTEKNTAKEDLWEYSQEESGGSKGEECCKSQRERSCNTTKLPWIK